MFTKNYYSALPKRYHKPVKSLLEKYDKSFVPALSQRNSTTQQTLVSNDDSTEPSIDEYFNNLLEQSFILAIHYGELVGFMSFIEDKELPYGTQTPSNYVSTDIVDESFRGQRLTKQFYQEMMRFKKPITTRTWSSNYSHIAILKSMGFENVKTLPNDRGENIDTVYYEYSGNYHTPQLSVKC